MLVYLSSVSPSVTRADQSKQLKLGLCNFNRTLATSLYFLWDFYLSVELGFIVCFLYFMHICHARHYSTPRNVQYRKRRRRRRRRKE